VQFYAECGCAVVKTILCTQDVDFVSTEAVWCSAPNAANVFGGREWEAGCSLYENSCKMSCRQHMQHVEDYMKITLTGNIGLHLYSLGVWGTGITDQHCKYFFPIFIACVYLFHINLWNLFTKID